MAVRTLATDGAVGDWVRTLFFGLSRGWRCEAVCYGFVSPPDKVPFLLGNTVTGGRQGEGFFEVSHGFYSPGTGYLDYLAVEVKIHKPLPSCSGLGLGGRKSYGRGPLTPEALRGKRRRP